MVSNWQNVQDKDVDKGRIVEQEISYTVIIPYGGKQYRLGFCKTFIIYYLYYLYYGIFYINYITSMVFIIQCYLIYYYALCCGRTLRVMNSIPQWVQSQNSIIKCHAARCWPRVSTACLINDTDYQYLCYLCIVKYVMLCPYFIYFNLVLS